MYMKAPAKQLAKSSALASITSLGTLMPSSVVLDCAVVQSSLSVFIPALTTNTVVYCESFWRKTELCAHLLHRTSLSLFILHVFLSVPMNSFDGRCYRITDEPLQI